MSDDKRLVARDGSSLADLSITRIHLGSMRHIHLPFTWCEQEHGCRQ